MIVLLTFFNEKKHQNSSISGMAYIKFVFYQVGVMSRYRDQQLKLCKKLLILVGPTS